MEAFIGHGYGPNSDDSVTLPWFLSLRAGGNTPPRRASATRTIRSVNKGIGISGRKWPAAVHRIGLLLEDNSGADLPDARTRHNRDLEPSAFLS